MVSRSLCLLFVLNLCMSVHVFLGKRQKPLTAEIIVLPKMNLEEILEHMRASLQRVKSVNNCPIRELMGVHGIERLADGYQFIEESLRHD